MVHCDTNLRDVPSRSAVWPGRGPHRAARPLVAGAHCSCRERHDAADGVRRFRGAGGLADLDRARSPRRIAATGAFRRCAARGRRGRRRPFAALPPLWVLSCASSTATTQTSRRMPRSPRPRSGRAESVFPALERVLGSGAQHPGLRDLLARCPAAQMRVRPGAAASRRWCVNVRLVSRGVAAEDS